MRVTRLVLAAAAAAASFTTFTAPALADHGCVPPPTEHFREICVIPHQCWYYPETGDIRCDYHG